MSFIFHSEISGGGVILQLFTTAGEAISYFNERRAIDGRALVLPSQQVGGLFGGSNLFGVVCGFLMCKKIDRG